MHWLHICLELFLVFQMSVAMSKRNVDFSDIENGNRENRLAFVPVDNEGEQQDDGSEILKSSSLVEEAEDIADQFSLQDDDSNTSNVTSDEDDQDSILVEKENLDDDGDDLQKHNLKNLADYLKEIDEDYKEDIEALEGEVSGVPRSGGDSENSDSPHDGVSNLANSPEVGESRKVPVRACSSGSLKKRIVNRWMDTVIRYVRTYLKSRRLDPLSLPVYQRGSFRLYNGRVYGLSNIRRVGDSRVAVSRGNLNIDVTLAVSNLRVYYNWKGKLCSSWKSGRISASLKLITVRIHLRVGLRPGARPQLVVFQVGHPTGLRVNLYGLGTFGSVASQYLQRIVKRNLQQKLQYYGKRAITIALARYRFPRIKL